MDPLQFKLAGPAPGTVIARKYELMRLVGVGGMGSVFEARHLYTRRRVALKVLHPNIAHAQDALARFMREAQAASAIGHPAIVDVFDAGQDPGEPPYLAFEFLDGEDLGRAMARGRIDPARAVRIAVQLLDALAAAHERGMIHRDIKPENVFLVPDGAGGERVKLLDFGIVKQAEAEGAVGITTTGALLGTPKYMSPEQANAAEIDARSDLWSVGALLFHVLAGRPPFLAQSSVKLIVAIVTGTAPKLGELRPDLQPELLAAVDRALVKDPALRWQSAREMASALRSVEGALARGSSHADTMAAPPAEPIPFGEPTPREVSLTDKTDAPAPIVLGTGTLEAVRGARTRAIAAAAILACAASALAVWWFASRPTTPEVIIAGPASAGGSAGAGGAGSVGAGSVGAGSEGAGSVGAGSAGAGAAAAGSAAGAGSAANGSGAVAGSGAAAGSGAGSGPAAEGSARGAASAASAQSPAARASSSKARARKAAQAKPEPPSLPVVAKQPEPEPPPPPTVKQEPPPKRGIEPVRDYQ